MGFDVNLRRNERLRLLEQCRTNIDTARWLRGQSLRAVEHSVDLMEAIDRARSERALRTLRHRGPLVR